MTFKEIDRNCNKERSDGLAELLRQAGVRFEQRAETEAGRRTVYVIAVHPDDYNRAEVMRTDAIRIENEEFVKSLRFTRQPYSDKDMLLTRQPNEEGYRGSRVYHGEPYDENMFRLVPGGWDHEHCFICMAKVLSGEEWWATHPPNFEDEIGLCLDCYRRLFGKK